MSDREQTALPAETHNLHRQRMELSGQSLKSQAQSFANQRRPIHLWIARQR
jgi:hypothetical protein